VKYKACDLLIAGWLLLTACGCQRFGLNQNEEYDKDNPFLSIPDPQTGTEQSNAD
jgi:hypothetical protein